MRKVVLLLASVLIVAGCAGIPEESTPHAVRDDAVPQPSGGVAEPTPNLNPDDLVREFVHKSGDPDAAEMYLTERAREAWDGGVPPTLIHDVFSTVPPPAADDAPTEEGGEEGEDGAERDTASILLRVTEVGRLGADKAFIPSIDENEHRIELRRVDGQWRIETPPEGRVYVPLTNFESSYRAVTVYYFDQDLRVTVPDLRYVAAQPASGLASRVIAVLLDGPSATLQGSVRSPLEGVGTRTNVVPDPDGALVVDLDPLGGKTTEQRELIAAQIVLSLQNVTSSRLRLKGDGEDLIPGHGDWRPGDLKTYNALTKPSPDQPGLVVVDGRLRSLPDGGEVEGPAGNGEYTVVSAAQSIDGGQLAVVTNDEGRLRLRVGPFGGELREVDLDATTMTRPTWLVSTSNEQASREVWTVEDGNVVRVVPIDDGSWKSIEVNASDLEDYGRITQLRLSRDGTRVAMVTDAGRLLVASVVRDKESVSLRQPRQLQPTMIVAPIGVDWLSQDKLVVATEQSTLPVVDVSVDGLQLEAYDTSNLRPPIRAITAAPERDVLVTDSAAVFGVPGPGHLWRQLQSPFGPNAIPFYPG